ncbi:hypothetical protein DMA15_36380 [Streptomyces sp. WAC 01529]|uniref:phytanoyl-CoA dioxygenase family protein n=1 Tax=Streptomyces sp. WAC 01529 TaxID=2203205 RepID=UPI000F70BA19|nr:phytanoyl-CoA dioxygenase family protein [Streptomyces sp. WAC 01529]AZM57360.1 hypothetical protein DMA15_36380 [Streptomyces sp. WAC 01529]
MAAALANGPKIHLLRSWADRLVRHPRLLEIATSLLGPDVLFWSTSIFVEPGGDTDLAWHQDALTHELDDGDLAAFRVRLALTPTSPENGTMRFAARTHGDGVLRHHRAGHAAGRLRGEAADFDASATERHDVVPRPGQCSLRNMLVVHGSGLNRTDEPRVDAVILERFYGAVRVHLERFLSASQSNVATGQLVREPAHGAGTHG